MRWCVSKHVSMYVIFFVCGSYMAACRTDISIGKRFAEGCVEPALQYAGVSGVRTLAVTQTLPCRSNIGLCTSVRLSQMASLPQYGDGFKTLPGACGCFRSGGGRVMLDVVACTGSRTGRRSVLSSGDPYRKPYALTVGLRRSV